MVASRFRREQLAKAVAISGDESLETVATFRRRPLFSYGMAVVLVAIGVANLTTDQLWLRGAFVVAAVAAIVGASGFVTIGIGPTRAFLFDRSQWSGSLSGSGEPLPFRQVERVSALRWNIAGRRVWAWGERRRNLERVVAG